jgi:hypothetical protein
MQVNIDEGINPWIKGLNIKNKEEYINNLLHLGYMVSTNLQVTTNNDYTEKLLNLQQEKNQECMSNTIYQIQNSLQHLGNKMDQIEQRSNDNSEKAHNRLIGMVEDFTCKSKTSVLKGDIAENYIEDICNTYFPTIIVERTSGTAHAADLQLYSTDCPDIIIESKNYSHPVPKGEIDKLKDDMTRTNIKYAIFISFTSRVTAKKHMELEQCDGKYILYLSDIGFNKDFIAMGVNMITSVAKITNTNKPGIKREFIQDRVNQVIISLNKLSEISSSFTKTRATLISEEATIKNSLDNIHMCYINNEAHIKRIVDEINEEIHYKLVDIKSIEYEKCHNIEEIISDLDEKKQPTVRNILTELYTNNYKARKSEINPNIFDIYKAQTGKIISKLNTKSKIKLSITDTGIEFDLTKKNSIRHLDSYFQIVKKL